MDYGGSIPLSNFRHISDSALLRCRNCCFECATRKPEIHGSIGQLRVRQSRERKRAVAAATPKLPLSYVRGSESASSRLRRGAGSEKSLERSTVRAVAKVADEVVDAIAVGAPVEARREVPEFLVLALHPELPVARLSGIHVDDHAGAAGFAVQHFEGGNRDGVRAPILHK